MLQARVIPCLQIIDGGLYKTTQFKNPKYIGDPINAVKIFNEKEVDELIVLDITATKSNKEPNYELLKQLASECFMPLAYGGGITNFKQASQLFELGIEKIAINTAAINNSKLISEIVQVYGNQSIIVSIDLKKNFFGKPCIYTNNGTKNKGLDLFVYLEKLESLGVGELLITDIDREGKWIGYNIDLLKSITDKVKMPVIINGGCGNIDHISDAINIGKANGAAVGSMAVYQKQGMGVLISFPKYSDLEKVLNP